MIVTIYIPALDNTGKRFLTSHREKFELFLVETFGGYTLLPGILSGGWKEGERTYYDELYAYEISIGSIVNTEALKKTIERAKSHFKQKAIYIKYMGVSEIL